MSNAEDPGVRYRFKPPALDAVEVFEPDPTLAIEANTSLDLLQAVYRDAGQPISRRMRAAIAALPHEHPKLVAIGKAGQGFADGLERMRQQRERRQLGLVVDNESADGSVDAGDPLLAEAIDGGDDAA